MKWEEFFDELADAFKIPETLEEAIDYINKDPSLQAIIEDMSFRQVIINVLVAANIISEKDFNKSIEHFKKLFTKKFAEELLSKIEEFTENDIDTDELLDNKDIDEEGISKPHYDA